MDRYIFKRKCIKLLSQKLQLYYMYILYYETWNMPISSTYYMYHYVIVSYVYGFFPFKLDTVQPQ